MPVTPCRDKWKSGMTDRLRFINQMHRKPVDRSFNMEFGYWTENFTQWNIFADNGITNNDEAHAFFNMDRIVEVKGPIWMLPPFDEEVIEQSGDYKIIRNVDGLLAEVPADGHSTIPHYLKSSIASPDDWKKVKAERFSLDHPDRKVDVESIKAAHPPGRDYPLGVHCGSMIGKIRDTLTFEGLTCAWYEHPAMVEDMVETVCLLAEQFLDQVLGEVDFDYASGWEDICCISGPLVTLEFFKDVVAPRYKRIGDKLHANGIDIWYTDCDGDVRPLLPYFMDAGINCLFPFEVNSCCTPGELLDEYGGDLLIMGGVDKMQLGRGPDAIRKCLEALDPYVQRGGYIPFCDHRCPPNVTPEDYLYYLDLKEKMWGTV
ncbi:MAG: uroporphyrinogen decarboxylase family protein [Phycisphaerae bacterium]|nr:uroporphyrinogen decarboxylase family protein [Phycisphaerae bacterium]